MDEATVELPETNRPVGKLIEPQEESSQMQDLYKSVEWLDKTAELILSIRDNRKIPPRQIVQSTSGQITNALKIHTDFIMWRIEMGYSKDEAFWIHDHFEKLVDSLFFFSSIIDMNTLVENFLQRLTVNISRIQKNSMPSKVATLNVTCRILQEFGTHPKFAVKTITDACVEINRILKLRMAKPEESPSDASGFFLYHLRLLDKLIVHHFASNRFSKFDMLLLSVRKLLVEVTAFKKLLSIEATVGRKTLRSLDLYLHPKFKLNPPSTFIGKSDSGGPTNA